MVWHKEWSLPLGWLIFFLRWQNISAPISLDPQLWPGVEDNHGSCTCHQYWIHNLLLGYIFLWTSLEAWSRSNRSRRLVVVTKYVLTISTAWIHFGQPSRRWIDLKHGGFWSKLHISLLTALITRSWNGANSWCSSRQQRICVIW